MEVAKNQQLSCDKVELASCCSLKLFSHHIVITG